MKPRTTPTDRRGGRRVWREGSKEGQGPTHAPDTEPESACPRRPEPTDRNWMGRPSPECRSRLTFDRSPVRGAIGSWYELASASLVRSKPSRQDGSESCGRRGNAGSEA